MIRILGMGKMRKVHSIKFRMHYITFLLAILAFFSFMIPVSADESESATSIGYVQEGEYRYHTYAILESEYTWEDARVLCEEMGGHLVTITSEGEQEFLEDFTATYFDNHPECNLIWIGLKHPQITKTNSQFLWEWSTGEDLKYMNWYDDELNENQDWHPVLAESEPCYGVLNREKVWGFTPDRPHPVLCEWDNEGLKTRLDIFIHQENHSETEAMLFGLLGQQTLSCLWDVFAENSDVTPEMILYIIVFLILAVVWAVVTRVMMARKRKGGILLTVACIVIIEGAILFALMVPLYFIILSIVKLE